MQELTSCITFEPKEDNGELERAIEKYKDFFGEYPLGVKNGKETRINKIDNAS